MFTFKQCASNEIYITFIRSDLWKKIYFGISFKKLRKQQLDGEKGVQRGRIILAAKDEKGGSPMRNAQPYGRYDQGFFNTACQLVEEIVPRNYLHFLAELDASGMDRFRQNAKRAGQVAPTYTSFVVKAAAIALREHPHLNCMIQERPLSTKLIPLPDVTATVAVERMVGGVDMVFAPMIKNPDDRALADMTQEMRWFAAADVNDVPEFKQFVSLVKVARYLPTLVGRLFRLPSLSAKLWRKYRGGSFAVTSPAKYGGCDQVLPPWPWPLTFSFGAVKERPFAVAGQIAVRKTMRLTITADRRLANGAPLARFAERVKELLEHPELMEKSETPAATEKKAEVREAVGEAVCR
jgi:hypothetical protein